MATSPQPYVLPRCLLAAVRLERTQEQILESYSECPQITIQPPVPKEATVKRYLHIHTHAHLPHTSPRASTGKQHLNVQNET